MPSSTESPGPFDLRQFPHVAEVLSLWDDPLVRTIILCWGVRNGKTATMLSLLLYAAVNKPRAAQFAGPSEDKTTDIIDGLLYPMLLACPETAQYVLPEHKRNQRYVSLKRMRIRRTFSGSASTMAGFASCYNMATEVSKWSTAKSREAKPLLLFAKRGVNYPFESKFIYESTPAELGNCQITELANAPGVDRRRRHVPCPHCGEYQVLTFGDGTTRGGIRWERDADGATEINLAAATAYYECALCGMPIRDHQRPEMMRRGVWLSEGQAVGKGGVITGTRMASPDVALMDLSSLYSLSIGGWGWMAREFLKARAGGADGLRDFQNSLMARTWDPKPPRSMPHDLAGRMVSNDRRGVVPVWGQFLTVGIDVQDNGRRFPFVVCAWGNGSRGHLVEYGQCHGWDEVRTLLSRRWPHADGGQEMPVNLTLVDSGDESEVVYGLCRCLPRCLPSKGSSFPMDQEYKVVTLTPDKRKNAISNHSVTLVEINSHWTQRWVERQLSRHLSERDLPFTVPGDVAMDVALFEQLSNEEQVTGKDARGVDRKRWLRIYPDRPNDWRDCLRLAKVASTIATNGGQLWATLPANRANPTQERRPKVVETQQPPPIAGGWSPM